MKIRIRARRDGTYHAMHGNCNGYARTMRGAYDACLAAVAEAKAFGEFEL